jgi:hypothetical protein
MRSWRTARRRALQADPFTRRRALIFFGVVIVGLIAGLIFWPFLLKEVIQPVATVIWLMLRLFVLSIDQIVFWWLLVAAIVIYITYRLLRLSSAPVAAGEPNETSSPLDPVKLWQASIQAGAQQVGESPVKHRLTWLLTNTYASRQQAGPSYQVREAFEQRQIPIPDTVYQFLFPASAARAKASFWKDPLRAVRQALLTFPGKLRSRLRRWGGQEKAEYYRSIDEVLSMMENSLEISHDDDPTNPNND